MTNKNFKSVEMVDHKISSEYILLHRKTNHLGERSKRYMVALRINKNAVIVQGFRVDKGHTNGKEIHVIMSSGCIFIFNEGSGKLITVLISRITQTKRLYEACGKYAPNSILHKCRVNMDNKLYLV